MKDQEADSMNNLLIVPTPFQLLTTCGHQLPYTSKCNLFITYFQNFRNVLRNCLEVFWMYFGIFRDFLGNFMEFFGRIFWEEYFGRNFLGEIF